MLGRNMTDIKIGAHLVSARTGYTHHGIYVGNDSVIHYSGLSSGFHAGPIEETSLAEFSQGHDVSVRSYKNPKYLGLDAVERCKSRLGEASYDVQGNNCEHFCTWVIMGISESTQVESFEDFVDIFAPRVTALAKIRKHGKQDSSPSQMGKDAAQALGATAVSVLAAPALPVTVAVKAFKWWKRRNP
jgi:hypothetical protein